MSGCGDADQPCRGPFARALAASLATALRALAAVLVPRRPA